MHSDSERNTRMARNRHLQMVSEVVPNNETITQGYAE
jgi:hypothetical protein